MVAASILPITIYNKQLYFLFGKENDMEDSASGWSDFGGRVDPGETIFQAALREGSEELTGFLGDESTIRGTIKKNGGFHKMIFDKYHVHLFYLPYDENLPKYYNHNHKFLWERMDNKILNETKLFEKIEIKWFSIEEMNKNKKDFRNFYQKFIDEFIEKESILKKFVKSKQHTKQYTLKNNKK